MTQNLIFFETSKDLEELTGLTHDELWEHGFNLDDMDWGFCTDIDCFTTETDEWGYENTSYDYEKNPPAYISRLLDMMNDYCVGYCHAFYNGKHYFTQHHA